MFSFHAWWWKFYKKVTFLKEEVSFFTYIDFSLITSEYQKLETLDIYPELRGQLMNNHKTKRTHLFKGTFLLPHEMIPSKVFCISTNNRIHIQHYLQRLAFFVCILVWLVVVFWFPFLRLMCASIFLNFLLLSMTFHFLRRLRSIIVWKNGFLLNLSIVECSFFM